LRSDRGGRELGIIPKTVAKWRKRATVPSRAASGECDLRGAHRHWTVADRSAEEVLEERPLAEFHRRVSIPALLLAQADLERGVLSEARQDRLAGTAVEMIDSIAPVADLLPLEDAPVIACLGGRSRLDEASAAVLTQLLEAEGAAARRRPDNMLATARRAIGWLRGSGTLVLFFWTARRRAEPCSWRAATASSCRN